ncbi:Indole-3-glycerol phosphate synthase [Planctomycetes bacterium Pan216]|uniref:Indole-3-glycerol phosphate synthase n=1 Tax=Kolteria novifilia TaxID=2527975 RepID=A0A518AXF7_9BACT|nr:Indole-3-glycerol phosphate synthase [Planctomycetes bacterium Pan216]
MKNALERIVEHKWTEIEALRETARKEAWELKARSLSPPADFLQAIRQDQSVSVIAEVKKASPSAGLIREDFDPAWIATRYAAGGAACLSVITDEEFFQGSLRYLRDVREAVALPILRKEFILDPIQIFESRLAGASACLLIAECLEATQLNELVKLVKELGMTVLVELYEAANLSKVLDSGARLVGINNRDLQTFETDLAHTIELRHKIPDHVTLVSESGIKTRADVLRLEEARIDAILVGETLMRADDPGAKLAELLGRPIPAPTGGT